jgi:hypothetical protein
MTYFGRWKEEANSAKRAHSELQAGAQPSSMQEARSVLLLTNPPA